MQLVKGHIRDRTRLIFGKNKGHVSRCPLKTRFGPNRVAADTEGNGELDFWVIFENFWRYSQGFLEKF